MYSNTSNSCIDQLPVNWRFLIMATLQIVTAIHRSIIFNYFEDDMANP
jgi:hypothetical protein